MTSRNIRLNDIIRFLRESKINGQIKTIYHYSVDVLLIKSFKLKEVEKIFYTWCIKNNINIKNVCLEHTNDRQKDETKYTIKLGTYTHYE